MATIDMNIPRDRVRLAIADTSDLPILVDSTIDSVLTRNNGNEPASIKQCAGYILGQLSHNTDEKLDRLQFMGSQAFSQYKAYLREVICGSLGTLSVAGIYAAGVDKQDVIDNNNDSSVVHKHLPLQNNLDYLYRKNAYEFE